MVRYFYLWTPLVIVGSVAVLALPWLGLIALGVVVLVVAAALIWGIVFVPYAFSRSVIRAWHSRLNASPCPAATVLLAHVPSERQST